MPARPGLLSRRCPRAAQAAQVSNRSLIASRQNVQRGHFGADILHDRLFVLVENGCQLFDNRFCDAVDARIADHGQIRIWADARGYLGPALRSIHAKDCLVKITRTGMSKPDQRLGRMKCAAADRGRY